VLGVLPSPLEEVVVAAELTDVIDIGHLPEELSREKPAAWKRIPGALSCTRERVAFVHFSQSEPRARLTHAHEIGHRILPWHQGAFQLDDEERLLGNTQEQLEVEAYLAGAHLIFPGRRFLEHALDYEGLHRHAGWSCRPQGRTEGVRRQGLL
jgi:hypothetical protein